MTKAKKQQTKEDKIIKVSFNAPASLKKAVKLKAAEEDRSLGSVLCYLMEAYVKGKIEINGV